tara:strand:+ start:814 stop:3714 length:2901 start_codon:yes stop_codon:yes gene_type:complete
MSDVRKFKFVSPGVFIDEIDNSQLPATPEPIGPVIVGRFEKGPGLRPVKVESFSEFVEIFGNPSAGGRGGDVWRDGNYMAPTYAAYAAQAYLRNSSPVTIVRVMGAQHTDVTDGGGGEAGWRTDEGGSTTEKVNAAAIGSNGGAYGLFLINSAAAGTTPATGVLAAVWYLNEGAIALSGTLRGGNIVTGAAGLFQSTDAKRQFRAIIKDKSGNIVEDTAFNFARSSDRYVRKVFNTNPTLTNHDVTRTNQRKKYFLGQTYERHVERYVSQTGSGGVYGMILGLQSGSSGVGSNFKFGTQNARTGWFISQDITTNSGTFDAEQQNKLFRLQGINNGEWEQANIKISIQDLKSSTNTFDPYGSFSVVIRRADDHDGAVRVLERYSNVTLNPYSSDYIGRRIGTQHIVWDDTDRRYRTYGAYPNKSKYVRVEMNEDVDAGSTDPTLLPFGFFGPVRFTGFVVLSGSDKAIDISGAPTDNSTTNDFENVAVAGDTSICQSIAGAYGGSPLVEVGTASSGLAITASFLFPSIPLRVSASDGDMANPQEAYFGIDTTQAGNNRFDPSYKDTVRVLPDYADSFSTGDATEFSFVFTLDDLIPTGSVGAVYVSGSRAAENSFTAISASYKGVLNNGFDRFTAPMFGGFDGLDIYEKEPLRNESIGTSDASNYIYYSLKRAIDTVSDPEVVEMNLLSVPGVTKTVITDHAIRVCESRGDALAIIDVEGGYTPNTENTKSETARKGDVTTTVNNMRDRELNTSYGACYYPWVQIKDTISGAQLWAPPSIVAIGVLSSAQRKSELWFAPAGFTRGGLSEGAAGLPVTGIRQRLTSKERDKLYEANINPIAQFPAEGIVIFGQKTLQVTPSALDRVNVRRLLIFIKKEISRMAATTLFDQNVSSTWNRFNARARNFLESVKARFGLEDYRLILDSTTTTPDLIDRNIMYAKIFLKPAKAIEYIAIDFTITNSGASFED